MSRTLYDQKIRGTDRCELSNCSTSGNSYFSGGRDLFMKFQQTDFTEELMEKIKNTELALKGYTESLLKEYKSTFAKKDFVFDAGFHQEGNDPFMPGYSSSVSIAIAEKNKELIDIHTIKIWECERTFLGMPISKKIPGSNIIGELLDEPLEEIKEELKGYILDEFLNE